MKGKGIKLVLRNKIDHWLSTVEDEELRKKMKRDTIVTGGAIASLLLDEKINDFDVYFKTYETTLAVARYYLKRFQQKKIAGIECKLYLSDGFRKEIPDSRMFAIVKPDSDIDPCEDRDNRVKVVVKSAGVATEEGAETPYAYFETQPEDHASRYVSEVMDNPADVEEAYEKTKENIREQDEDQKYRPVFVSTNAITLSYRIQVVLRFWGEPDKIHENYDFVHCTNYWTSGDNKLVLRPAAIEALLTRELRYVGSRYPICSLIRIRKFVKRGFSINAGQILKMVWQVKDLDLASIDVLEDQLTGVDAAYFAQIIGTLREKFPEGKIDNAYLVEIIDRMF